MYLKKVFFIIFIKGNFKATVQKCNFEPKFQQNTIFFKKLKSMSKCFKNSFRQIKSTSYRYFWTSFHYGISSFVYRITSKNRCSEIGQIWASLQKMLWNSWHILKWHPDLSFFPTSDFRRVPILKTTYTIMKTCSEVSI